MWCVDYINDEPYLFHRQPVRIHSLLVLERSHESLDDIANIEHAHCRATDGIHGCVEHTVDDRVDDAGQSRIQYVTGILCAHENTSRNVLFAIIDYPRACINIILKHGIRTDLVKIKWIFAGDGTVEPSFQERSPSIPVRMRTTFIVFAHSGHSRINSLQIRNFIV